jgi:uncharacterized membrane protein
MWVAGLLVLIVLLFIAFMLFADKRFPNEWSRNRDPRAYEWLSYGLIIGWLIVAALPITGHTYLLVVASVLGGAGSIFSARASRRKRSPASPKDVSGGVTS